MGSKATLRLLPRSWLLVFSFFLVFGFVAAQSGDADTSINAFTDDNCKKQPKGRQVGTEDGECNAIKTTNATSVSIETLGHGCTITVYSDEFCSFDATAVREGECVSIGAFLLSFSVDGCTEDPPTSISTKRTPLTTSTKTASSATRSTTVTSTNEAGSKTTGTGSPTDTNGPNASSTAAASTKGLSNGAVAGIAVGVTIAGIALIALLVRWFFVVRRPGTPPAAPDHSAPPDESGQKWGFWPFGARRKASYAAFPIPPAELTGSYPDGDTEGAPPRPPVQPIYELSSAQYGELPTMHSPTTPTEGYKDFIKTDPDPKPEGAITPIMGVVEAPDTSKLEPESQSEKPQPQPEKHD